MPPATDDIAARFAALRAEVDACTGCELHLTRTRAVFGEGDPHADLMFVGEAPGYHEDQQGKPFVGQAGKLLGQLLETIGLTRERVFIANVLKSRPPNNRDPRPEEIAACEPYLMRQIELIAPRVICTLGNFATKLLSGSPTGITRVHGLPQRTVLGGRSVYLFPIFHPAAALYTPAMLATLKQDILKLPEVLAMPLGDEGDAAAPELSPPTAAAAREVPSPTAAAAREVPSPTAPTAPASPAAPAVPTTRAAPPAPASPASGPAEQLGLF